LNCTPERPDLAILFFWHFFENYRSSKVFRASPSTEKENDSFDKNVFGYILGDFFANATGTDVMTLKIFSPKNLAKKLAFLTQNKANF
jgi:hypothetical protein